MKFTLAAIIGSLAFASAKLGSKNRELKAENVGAYHTDAFEALAEKYSYASQRPKSELDLMMDVSDILAGYCAESDSTCRSGAYKATLKQFHVGRTGKQFVIPENMDESVRKHLGKAFDVIDTINAENVNEKIELLQNIQNDISELQDVSAADQMIGVASVSVAQESAKYWTKAFSDKEHPFSGMLNRIGDTPVKSINEHDRRLQVSGDLTWQDFFPIDYSEVIAADTQGAIDYSIEAVNEKPNIVFNFSQLFLALLAGAFPASAAVAFNTTGLS